MLRRGERRAARRDVKVDLCETRLPAGCSSRERGQCQSARTSSGDREYWSMSWRGGDWERGKVRVPNVSELAVVRFAGREISCNVQAGARGRSKWKGAVDTSKAVREWRHIHSRVWEEKRKTM